MKRRFLIIILIAFCASAGWSDLTDDAKKAGVLRDGLAITAAEGVLRAGDRGDQWLFEFAEDVNQPGCFIGAGESFRLLPCSTLEKLLADANNTAGASYRLWATVTGYRGENFIFATYFLPLQKTQHRPADQIQEKPAPVKQAPAINDPNDAIEIPEHILRRRRTRQTARPETVGEVEKDLAQDTILADRTGFITTLNDGRSIFTFDALGRNTQRRSLELLPCRGLEIAQNKLAGSGEKLRFKVAGVLTQYKGRQFLLLQRAARVYSHGNFAR